MPAGSDSAPEQCKRFPDPICEGKPTCAALEQEGLPRSPLRTAIAYMGDLWPGLLRFLDDPRHCSTALSRAPSSLASSPTTTCARQPVTPSVASASRCPTNSWAPDPGDAQLCPAGKTWQGEDVLPICEHGRSSGAATGGSRRPCLSTQCRWRSAGPASKGPVLAVALEVQIVRVTDGGRDDGTKMIRELVEALPWLPPGDGHAECSFRRARQGFVFAGEKHELAQLRGRP